MNIDALIQIILPASLFIIMMGMGLSLVVDDFKRVLIYPKAVVVGAVCQLLLLPLVGVAVILLFDLPPVLAVGLLVLAFSPGGTTSNMISYLAGGNLALSVTLTAIVSLLTPFTIPLFTSIAIAVLMNDSQAFELPLLPTIAQLLLITVVPIALGMKIHHKFPEFAKRSEGAVKVFSLVLLFLIIAAVIVQNKENMVSSLIQVGPAAVVMNIVAMLLGIWAASAAKLDFKQRVSIGVEVGIQNGTTALLVTSTILGNAEMSIPPTIYSILMFATGALFAVIAKRLAHKNAVAVTT